MWKDPPALSCSTLMKTQKKSDIRSATQVAMMKRYGNTTTVMKDRREPRKGNRNKVRDYIQGEY